MKKMCKDPLLVKTNKGYIKVPCMDCKKCDNLKKEIKNVSISKNHRKSQICSE